MLRVGVDVGADRGFRLFGRAVDAATDLLFVVSAKNRSAILTQELAVGVKCTCRLGCDPSHLRIAGVVWVA